MQKFYYIFNSYFTFKPYYKWITFNTEYKEYRKCRLCTVLNLIINGLPSIPYSERVSIEETLVLNLIINGLPSILQLIHFQIFPFQVSNLIINGLPSIPYSERVSIEETLVLNLIINGLPSIQLFIKGSSKKSNRRF